MDGTVKALQKGPANTGIHRIVDRLDAIITPITTYVAYIGSGVLGILVLMLMYSIIARRTFNSPLKGSFELTELCLVVVVFTLLAFDSLKHEKMLVELVVDRFPKKIRLTISPIIYIIAICMLGILSWQLFVQADRVQGFHQTTRVLQIPIFPFVYTAAVGVTLLTIVYIKHFLISLDKAVNK